MKVFYIFCFFFVFLLIRSGNSHFVMRCSDRPAISFMERQKGEDQADRLSRERIHQELSKNNTHSQELQLFAMEEIYGENFSILKDYHLQMVICTIFLWPSFLLYIPRNAKESSSIARFIGKISFPKYISLRSLRI